MGIFSAKKCEICGQEKRLGMKKLKSQAGDKYICEDCLFNLGVYGFIYYSDFYTKVPYNYENVMAYASYYKDKLGSMRAPIGPDGNPDTFFVSQFTSINHNFTLLNHYYGLGVANDEVFAISIASSNSMSGALSEGIIITYLTTNPFVPYFRDLVIAKKGLFSGKAKEEREIIFNLYPEYYRNLRYPIGEGKAIEKQLKKDGSIAPNIKKPMLSVLKDSRDNFFDTAANSLSSDAKMNKSEWAFDFNENLGYVEVINDAIK